jgi:hypothetical protein
LSVSVNWLVLKYFGHEIKWDEASWLAAIMTALSFARSYVLRRFYNWRDHG